MFEVGDRVEVIAEHLPVKGNIGVIKKSTILLDVQTVGVVLDGWEDLDSPVLPFFADELKKVGE